MLPERNYIKSVMKYLNVAVFCFVSCDSSSIVPHVGPFVGRLVRRLVGPLVGRSVRPSVPTMQLRGKLVTSRLLREEEEEEENWLRRDSFAPRD